jgi:hypothetical protein
MWYMLEGEGGGGGGGGDPTPPVGGETPEQLKERARIAELRLREAEAERDALKAADAERARKEAEDKGKFKELYESQKLEHENYKKQVEQERIRDAVRAAAIQAGLIDADLADLIPLDKVRVENGRVIGVEEAVNTHKANKPLLFTKVVGGSGNPVSPAPGGDGGSGGGDPNSVKNLKKSDYEKRKQALLRSL